MSSRGLAGAVLATTLCVTVFVTVLGDPESEAATVTNCDAAKTTQAGTTTPTTTTAANATDTPAAAGTGGGTSRRVNPLAEGTYTISDVFGSRGGDHKGIDMAAADGTTIYAATDGKVVAAGPASGFGNWIVIDTVDENNNPLSTVYGHMWDRGVTVSTGATVAAGDPIGAVGSAGQSSGPHLHFEVVPGGRFAGGQHIDPQPWLAGAATPDSNATPSTPSTEREQDKCAPGFGTAGGALEQNDIPDELVDWYRKAGSLCPEISASVLAAQGKQESGFRRNLTSPAGAQGLAQFLPSTATSINPEDGQPYVIDADGNGSASVWDDGDAIIGQGRYMCAIAHKIQGWMDEGKVSGDLTELTLAGYNAGEGAVLASGGMPNQIPHHFSETQPYVANIIAMEPNYRAAGSTGRHIPSQSGDGNQVVEAAREYLGADYVWGGGGIEGDSGGGFDCSGLTSYAIYQGSGKTIILPRTSEQQWEIGVELNSLADLQPGDLVFGAWNDNNTPNDPSDDLPGHVGIAIGEGQMIHAPTTGDVVKEAPLQDGMRARRVL
ncbi:peptidoglycan DD-metalloendopeptidase family protein [Nocardia asteroides]|uniref:peptidoglycan DD-metalloendopeptidase family protein n=1 Tax=Nocardia asteroides TaxID=1824 RepID=UPI0037C6A17E